MAPSARLDDTKCILLKKAPINTSKNGLLPDPVNTEACAAGIGQQTSWSSIYVAAALSFVGAVQFSLYFSSMWQYLRMVIYFT
jgi:hypothetical protein